MPSYVATRFHGPAQVSNAAATKYTVAAAQRIVIRHVHISNPSGSPVTFTLSVGADAAATRLYDAFSIPANSVRDDGWYVALATTEIIQALAGTNNILTLTIDGDLFTVG